MTELGKDSKRLKLPLTRIIGLGFGAFVALAIALVLTLSVMANFKNTFSLLNDKAILITEAMDNQLRKHFRAVQVTAQGLKPFFDSGMINLDDPELAKLEMRLAMAGNPTVTVLMVTLPDGRRFGAYREGHQPPQSFDGKVPDSGGKSYDLPQLDVNSPPTWGPLVNNKFGQFANVSVPIVRHGKMLGTLTAASSLDDLSRAIANLDEGADATTFIIANDDQVIMHSDTTWLQTGGQPAMDLPASRLDFGDPVLAAMETEELLPEFRRAAKAGIEVSVIEAGNDEFVMMRSVIPGFSNKPWIIGQYFQSASVSREMERLAGSAMVGFFALIVAVIVAIWLGRRVARPLKELAKQSEKVGTLSLDEVERLPRSRVQELDQVAIAFNAMVEGLKAMNTYVPRSLFIKLMRLGGQNAAEAREAELTILFTDIVGFTAISEHMSASETARKLNDHFALLVDAVESNGGTVDKFIGDGMLAFWGAPDDRPDHAQAAVTTARRIAAALHDANEQARAEGRDILRLRIGIHTGFAVVGNVGALDRWNYTVVGDTVNTAERLQSLGREVGREDEVVILASADTVAELPGERAKEHVGMVSLRGRSREVGVWKLDPFQQTTSTATRPGMTAAE
ncbi:adenylate/guanylate cyclase domain-containing protein [Roseibium sp. RKSG952]|uniref:adenylate/guanylate cyclase domain-containing protein n=1 Tax=Roseibium sp. RKSG952 TaxID=2529384 RepID=UPI0012BC039D|nr:adenylate/guanylate cyclase domain-containing protein [Roseibium sp. RKSG952]MTH98951.1 adenylate/guanylate cyclase domain-containing protein [Roseibium sp. RKSG952]